MTKYEHNHGPSLGNVMREIVFGAEDGMVSTLGAITGIAIGSQDRFTVLMAGSVIVAVESISMGIGSYLANRSQDDVSLRLLDEEREEIVRHPKEERVELLKMLRRDGWPENMAQQMAEIAAGDRKLMLKEMAYREHGVFTAGPTSGSSIRAAMMMFFSYIIGGSVALAAYFLLPVATALPVSIIVTLAGLFGLGAATSRYTHVMWAKAGGRILLLGSIALGVGYLVGGLAGSYR